jgi:hypothetical protein
VSRHKETEFRVDEDAILDAIRTHPGGAAEALAAVQLGVGVEKRVTAEAIRFSAAMKQLDEAELRVPSAFVAPLAVLISPERVEGRFPDA